MISERQNIHLLDARVPSLEDLELFMSNSAFLWGKSVFTTALVCDGGLSFYQDHFERIMNSVQWLWGEAALVTSEKLWLSSLDQLPQLLKSVNSQESWKLRFTFFEDSSKVLHSLLSLHPFESKNTLEMKPLSLELKLMPARYRERIENIKLGSYLDTFRVQENMDNIPLFYNEEDQILETPTSNILFYDSFRDLFNYPYEAGEMLLGIGLKKGMDGLPIEKISLNKNDLSRFTHAFLINSLRGVQPVVNLDGRTLEVNEKLCTRVSKVFNQNMKKTMRILWPAENN